MIIHNVEQGTEEWHRLRMKRFTGSTFAKLMGAKSNKGYSDEIYRVVGEVLTDEYEETYKSADMERGNEQEDTARRWYEIEKNILVDTVGFIEHNERIGFSPDGLIDKDGMLEIKTAKRSVQIGRLDKNRLPPEYKWQVQGGLWICKRDWCDFLSYNPEMPKLLIRIYRDDKAILELETRINEAIEEVQEIIHKLRIKK